jgi:hypothetical protein
MVEAGTWSLLTKVDPDIKKKPESEKNTTVKNREFDISDLNVGLLQ